MHETEHNYLLQTLEKNLEIPKDCTYANQKAIDDQVSSQKGPLLLESTLVIREASPGSQWWPHCTLYRQYILLHTALMDLVIYPQEGQAQNLQVDFCLVDTLLGSKPCLLLCQVMYRSLYIVVRILDFSVIYPFENLDTCRAIYLEPDSIS